MSKRTQTSELKHRFKEAYDEHADSIFRYSYFRLSDKEKAVDIVQDTFVRFWEYISAESDVQNVRALLYRIASNAIIDSYRKHKSFSLDVMIEDGFDPADSISPTEEAFNRDEADTILKAINSLNDDDRNLMYMRYVEGLSVNDIAKHLDERPNTVSVKIHRLIKELQKVFKVEIDELEADLQNEKENEKF